MNISFILNEEQSKQAREWQSVHRKECPMKYAGAIGGKETWKFTYTSLGLIVVIDCACGAKCDVSDYDSW